MANSVVRLSIDSHEFDANIKRAGEALNKFFDQARKGDRTFEVLDDDAMEVIKTFGRMETSSKSARGQLSELTKGFTDLSLAYKRMTDEEKASPVGKEITNQLDILKGRIQDTKKDLASINQELSGSKFGQFGGVIDTIGHKMGVSANLTELLTSKTALMYAGIGAGIAIVGKATDAWVKYNNELAKQDQITTVTTGLKGTEADHMTDVMRALSDTYKVDFREAVNAANTLMTQFGVNGDKAIQLIKDGMQGMIQGDGPKLLQMIKQYAPAFRDAGVSASQLVAVIHNSEGGIFTDQNMNAIVMGMKNIRLMTKQTSDALAQLGIDGKKMSQDLNAGTITVFDALKQVAKELQNVDGNSQAAGQVMQAVFGRQGVTAGTNIAKAIETLNTNLEETKKQTGELGDAFADLQTANEHLNTAIREAFSYDGWAEMATGIKSTLIDTLADVIDKLGTIKGLLAGITPSQSRQKKYGTSGTPDEVKRDLEALSNADTSSREAMYQSMLQKYEKRFQDASTSLYNAEKLYNQNEQSSNWQGVPFVRKALDRHYWSTKVNTARSNVAAEEDVISLFRSEAQKILNPEEVKKPLPTYTGGGGKTTTTAKELTPLQETQKKISDLTNEALTADDDMLEVIRKEVAALNEQLKVYKEIQDYVSGKTPNFNVTVGDRKAFEREQLAIFEANGGTASRLESMQYSVMKEIKAEDVKVDTKTLHTLLKDALQNGIDTTSLELTPIAEQIGEGINVPDEKWQAILDKYNELKAAIGEEPIQIDFNTGKIATDGKKAEDTWKSAASAVQSVGSAFSQIEDPGVKAMGTVMQAIASIALGFAQAASAKDTTASGWAWLAWLAAGTAAMSTTIATIHSLTHFAEGGIVGGNDHTDNTPVMVSSGELILNRSQQGVLADALMSGNNQGGAVGGTPYVTGEKIVMGVNNWGRATGRGELVFSKS